MKNHEFLRILPALGLLALAGCSSNNPSPSSPAPVTVVEIAPTASFTPGPTGTATFTPMPTSTPVTVIVTFTFTPTPTSSFTSTPTATSTATPTATSTSTSTGTPTFTPVGCANVGVTVNNGGGGSTSGGHFYTDQFTASAPNTFLHYLSFSCADTGGSSEPGYLALYDAGSGTLVAGVSFQSQGLAFQYILTAPVPEVTLTSGAAYNIVLLVPDGTNDIELGQSTVSGTFEYGSYAGGAPPANYSTLHAGGSGFLAAHVPALYFTACPE